MSWFIKYIVMILIMHVQYWTIVVMFMLVLYLKLIFMY